MRLLEVLFMLLMVVVFPVHTNLGVILQPFKSLLGWQGTADTKNLSLGIENVGTVAEVSRARAQVDHPTPVEVSKTMERKPSGAGRGVQTLSLLIQDFNSTTSSEQHSEAASPADSPDQTHSPSSLATKTTTTLSGHLTSVTSSQARATSVGSVSEPIVGAKTFHLADLKIPGGENPDAANLPDVASSKDLGEPQGSANTKSEKLSVPADSTPSGFEAEPPSMARGPPLSATLEPTRVPHSPTTAGLTPPLEAAFPAAEIVAATDVSLRTTKMAAPTADGNAGGSVQSQPDQPASRRFVFQDVNDLFQSDDS